ncbi:MAG: DUF4126 domain-containing protein [Cytophagales bacterium]|nr:DUF4126 domain-containing protein [Armatimonadota bacterium]
MDAAHWVLALLLGLSLAASAGLNAFLPLLMLSVASRFHLAGIDLGSSFAWLGTDVAMVVLTVATVVEIVGDKIPAVDHALHAVGLVVRPIAGWLAAASVLGGADPVVAAVVGLIIGAPTALGFHAAKTGTRAASSATTLGIANPFLSAIEDVLSFLVSLIGFLAPLLVPFVLALLAWLLWRLTGSARARLASRKASEKLAPP